MTFEGAFLDLLTTHFWVGVIVFFRVGAMVSVLPGFGEQVVSVRFKLAAGVFFTAVVAPALSELQFQAPPNLMGMATLLVVETITGLFFGIMLRFFIFSIQTAGSIAAQSTSLSQLFGQPGAEPLPAIAHILTTAALALLMSTGFHIKAAEYIVLSYEIVPVAENIDSTSLLKGGRQQVSASFALAFTLAAPFVILSVIYNLTLGVINKAMPQLMVAFVGAPVVTFGSIFLLFITAPFILTIWLGHFESFLILPFGGTK